jgi:hypothetical protein
MAVELAGGLKKKVQDRTIQVATMAYSLTVRPPSTIDRLPESVSVDVVYNFPWHLPPSSPENQAHAAFWKRWREKTAHLGVYTHYPLRARGEIPLPCVTGMAEWMRFFKDLGVETQMSEITCSTSSQWRANPWLYYAYSRLSWHPEEPAGQVIEDFFRGYYREAWRPMMEYYTTLEQHVRRNNLAAMDRPGLERMYTPRVLRGMQRSLQKARALATDYRTRERIEGTAAGFRNVLKQLDVEPAELERD